LWPGLSTVDPLPLAWIDFLVDDFGNITLHFDTRWTKLVDCNGNVMQSPWNLVMVDGYFDNLPVQPVQRLIKVIETWNLLKGTEKSLTGKLGDVNRLLDKGNENGAIRKLNDFIIHVEVLRGNEKLTGEQADYLIASAQAILDDLV